MTEERVDVIQPRQMVIAFEFNELRVGYCLGQMSAHTQRCDPLTNPLQHQGWNVDLAEDGAGAIGHTRGRPAST